MNSGLTLFQHHNNIFDSSNDHNNARFFLSETKDLHSIKGYESREI